MSCSYVVSGVRVSHLLMVAVDDVHAQPGQTRKFHGFSFIVGDVRVRHLFVVVDVLHVQFEHVSVVMLLWFLCAVRVSHLIVVDNVVQAHCEHVSGFMFLVLVSGVGVSHHMLWLSMRCIS